MAGIVQRIRMRKANAIDEKGAEKQGNHSRTEARSQRQRYSGGNRIIYTCSHDNLRAGSREKPPMGRGYNTLLQQAGLLAHGSSVMSPPSRNFTFQWLPVARHGFIPLRSTVAGSAAIKTPGLGPSFAFPLGPTGFVRRKPVTYLDIRPLLKHRQSGLWAELRAK